MEDFDVPGPGCLTMWYALGFMSQRQTCRLGLHSLFLRFQHFGHNTNIVRMVLQMWTQDDASRILNPEAS